MGATKVARESAERGQALQLGIGSPGGGQGMDHYWDLYVAEVRGRGEGGGGMGKAGIFGCRM